MEEDYVVRPRKFGVPLFAVVTTYLALSVLVATSLGWGYSYNKGVTFMAGLNSMAQTNINDAVQKTAAAVMTTAEYILSYQASRWTSGRWNLNQTGEILESMKNQLDAFDDAIAGLFFIPRSGKGKLGYYQNPGNETLLPFEENGQTWDRFVSSLSLTESQINAAAKTKHIFDAGVNLLQNSYYRLSIVTFATTPTNDMASVQNLLYSRHVTSTSTCNNQNQVLIGADLSTYIFQRQIDVFSKNFPFPMVVAIFDVSSGAILASSVDMKLVDDHGDIVKYNDTKIPYFQDFASFVKTDFGGSLTKLWEQSVATRAHIAIKTSLRSYTASANTIVSLQDTAHSWIIVAYLNADAVSFEYSSATKRTEAYVFVLMTSLWILGSMFFIAVSLSLHRIVNELKNIRDLKFRDLEQTDQGIARHSLIREISILQESFRFMIETLTDHRRKRSVMPERQSSKSMVDMAQTNPVIPFTTSNIFSANIKDVPPVPEIPTMYLKTKNGE
ncbi:hypothetical protein HDU97_000337 [Phlyctochytrium planicorne]|nr:hypothetical protein HDU97_000337 [Phlyctochytrium planicorne]